MNSLRNLCICLFKYAGFQTFFKRQTEFCNPSIVRAKLSKIMLLQDKHEPRRSRHNACYSIFNTNMISNFFLANFLMMKAQSSFCKRLARAHFPFFILRSQISLTGFN